MQVGKKMSISTGRNRRMDGVGEGAGRLVHGEIGDREPCRRWGKESLFKK